LAAVLELNRVKKGLRNCQWLANRGKKRGRAKKKRGREGKNSKNPEPTQEGRVSILQREERSDQGGWPDAKSRNIKS